MNRSSFLRRITPVLLLTALLCTLALPVSALLAAPVEASSVSAFSKNTTVGRTVTFSAQDFRVLGGGTLDAIRLTTLPDPAAGVLTLGGANAVAGTLVTMAEVEKLQFSPLLAPTMATTQFTFSPLFSGGNAGADVAVNLYLLSKENQAPVAENMELSTFKNVALTSRFSATDPEGDLLTFQLVDKPARGAVTISGEAPDFFVYTPYENKGGKDSFTYVAVDTVGNVSPPATVKVKIEKPKTRVTYADMEGVPSYNAALTLAERNILVGECMGGSYYFNPQLSVSRDQFVALAMNTLHLEPLDDITTTGFYDDAVIPTWAKGYVSSALKSGAVQGYPGGDGQIVFCPNQPVTRGEAAVLLNRMLAITDVDAESAYYPDAATVPTWALQSAVNLETVGVLQTDATGALALSETLTRGAAAELLASALEVVERRDDGGFFPW